MSQIPIVPQTLKRALVAGILIGGFGTTAALAETTKTHALSLIGKPAYGPDFKHFDWLNPDAPKGGRMRRWNLGAFDNLNGFSVQGNAAIGLGLLHDTIMETSLDEPGTEYCLICEWVSYPSDYSSVTYRLRPEAKFNDGSPITVDDVIFSLTALKEANPFYGAYYKNIVKAEETGDREVTFTFDKKNNRELPQITGQLPILSKAFWTAKDANGNERSLKRRSQEVPISSGPYKIKSFKFPDRISYERIKNHWAADLPVRRGMYNFDELTWLYYRDQTAAFEDFKKGDLGVWQASSAKQWAAEFNFPAIRDGKVKRKAFDVKRVAGMQGFAFNLRRKKFQDPRVRRAFNLAFDFEWSNRNLFFDQYTRLQSYFDNSELAATGLPEGRELEILNEVKDQVPPEVFTTPYKNPVNASPADFRNNLRQAAKLFREAGWTVKDRVLTNAAGEKLTVEILLISPTFKRVFLPYVRNLQRLGVQTKIRVVDTSQYQERTDTFDYDMIVSSFGQSFSPGNEQRDFWGSAAADRNGSRNAIGIKNPAIDKIIEKIIFASDRSELVAATRALDRVLLWNHYVVPNWHLPKVRLAWWDRFKQPDNLPALSPAPLQLWWQETGAASEANKS
ncbi:MAG: extracellular solute-binding protein [Pseudomonadota bacterium]